MVQIAYTQLSTAQRQDVRASQRTFEGAYIRTAFSELSFGLVILKLFTHEFLPVATVYTVHAILMIILALYQRHRMEKVFLGNPDLEFITSGHFVLMSAVLSIFAHSALLTILILLNFGIF